MQHRCCLRTETAVVLPCPTAGARANRISTFPLRCVTFLLSLFLTLSSPFSPRSFHVRSLLIGISPDSCNGQRSSLGADENVPGKRANGRPSVCVCTSTWCRCTCRTAEEKFMPTRNYPQFSLKAKVPRPFTIGIELAPFEPPRSTIPGLRFDFSWL